MKRLEPDSLVSSSPTKRSCNSRDDGADGVFIRLPAIFIGDNLACYPTILRNDPIARLQSSVSELDGKKYLERAWNVLQPAIKIIFEDEYESSSLSYTQISRAVMRACMTNSRETLLTMIKKECEPYVSKAIQSLENPNHQSLAVFMPLVETCWRDFKRKMTFVSDLASDINHGSTLCDMGKELFREHLSRAPILDKVILGILDKVNDERLGKTASNACHLKTLMEMFRGMGPVFAKPFVDSAKLFYTQQLLQQPHISPYLIFVERLLHVEEKICADNGYYFCWWSLKEGLESLLLKDQATLLEKGFTVLMNEGCMDDLRRMYGLFYRANLVCCMDLFLISYIGAKRGASEGLLSNLHTKVNKIWHRCFAQDSLLGASIRDSFKGLGLLVPDVEGKY